MKYAWIERNRKRWPVSVACAVLGVSPSGYHDHRVRSTRPRRGISNDALLVHIRAIHAETRGEYGWPRIWKELLARGIRVGKERVRKLMSLHGAYFSRSWTAFQADRGRGFSVIVDGVSG